MSSAPLHQHMGGVGSRGFDGVADVIGVNAIFGVPAALTGRQARTGSGHGSKTGDAHDNAAGRLFGGYVRGVDPSTNRRRKTPRHGLLDRQSADLSHQVGRLGCVSPEVHDPNGRS